MAAKLSGSGGDRYNVEQNHEINVTPFVDVMLVLLIIFMVGAPLTVPSVNVDLPNAVAVPSPNPPEPVYITIEANGALHLGDFPTWHRQPGRRSAQADRQARPVAGADLHPRRQGDRVRRLHGRDERAAGQRFL